MCINGYKHHSVKDTYPFCARCHERVRELEAPKSPKRITEHLERVLAASRGGDPLAEGYDDAKQGVPLSKNRYPKTKPEHWQAWIEGWRAGVEDLIKERKAS